MYKDGIFQYLSQEGFDTFLRRYTIGRNESTDYKYQTYIQRGTLDQNYIDFDIIVNIPTHQDILYIPGVWEVLKFAWIQYYSFLILIYVFLYQFFYAFVIRNKVFDSIEVSSINFDKLNSGNMHGSDGRR